jgi:helix-turn-helix protein
MTEPWSRVPARAAADVGLSRPALRILVALGRFVDGTGRAFPSLATLSQEAGIGRHKLPKLIGELERRGYLTRQHRRRAEDSGDFTSTIYDVVYDRGVLPRAGNTGCYPGQVTPVTQGGEHGVTQDGYQGVLPRAGTLTTHNGTAQGTAHQDSLAGFDDFWRIYPRKDDKPKARKAFKAASKKIDTAALIAGAERYAAERAGQDPQFTKYPATWLNAESWNNEPAAPTTRRHNRKGVGLVDACINEALNATGKTEN